MNKFFSVLACPALFLVASSIQAGSILTRLEAEIIDAGSQIQKASLLHDEGRLKKNPNTDKGRKKQEKALLLLSSTFNSFAKSYIEDQEIELAISHMFEHRDIGQIVDAFHYVAEEKLKEVKEFAGNSSSFMDDENNCHFMYPALHNQDWKFNLLDSSRDYISLDTEYSEDLGYWRVKNQRQENSRRFLDRFKFFDKKITRI